MIGRHSIALPSDLQQSEITTWHMHELVSVTDDANF